MLEMNKFKWIITIFGFCLTKGNTSEIMKMSNERIENTYFFQHKNYEENLNRTKDGARTLLELFNNSCKKYKENKYLGTVDGKTNLLSWQTYGEIEEKVQAISSFINHLTESDDIIGIFSINRYEWLVCEYASYMSNCSICPIYTNAKDESKALVLEETKMKICCVSGKTADNLYEILKKENNSKLAHLIVFDSRNELVDKFKELGIDVHFFEEILSEQRLNLKKQKITGESVGTICYTSGTGGKSKGVILTHTNFISTIAAFSKGEENEMIRVVSDDVYLSYLPLAHVMERICVSVITSEGGSIGFYRGDPTKAEQDYKIIRPTYIAAVPYVLGKFKDRILSKVSELWFHKRFFFHSAVKYKISRQSKGEFSHEYLDSKIFNKVKESFGGRIRAILCGSAAINPDLLSFMQAVFSVQIFQGYGQTETTGAITLKPFDYYEYNNVGIPFPCTRIKIVQSKEYEEKYVGKIYGEMFVKGNNVTQGYYNNPEANEKLFDADGWLRTGDILVYEDGVFKIVGRANARFKLAHGEYVDPEDLEEKFKSDLVEDAFICQSTVDTSKLVAVVVVSKQNATKEDVKKHVLEWGKELIKKKNINKIEIPSYIAVIKKNFVDLSDDLMTPTSKKKRNAFLKHFAKDLEEAQKEKPLN